MSKEADEKIEAFVKTLYLPETSKDKWFSNFEIRCFEEEGCPPSDIIPLIEECLEEYKLPFTLINKGVNPNSTENIRKAIGGTAIDEYVLSGILRTEPWRYDLGSQHGDILTVTTPLFRGESYSSFDDGSLIVHPDASPRTVVDEFFNMLGYNMIGEGTTRYTLRNLWNTVYNKLNKQKP